MNFGDLEPVVMAVHFRDLFGVFGLVSERKLQRQVFLHLFGQPHEFEFWEDIFDGLQRNLLQHARNPISSHLSRCSRTSFLRSIEQDYLDKKFHRVDVDKAVIFDFLVLDLHSHFPSVLEPCAVNLSQTGRAQRFFVKLRKQFAGLEKKNSEWLSHDQSS